MARICVITQNPAWGGGVLSKLHAFLAYAASREHTCDLYFPTTVDTSAGEALRELDAVDNIFPVRWFEKLPDCVRSTCFARRCKIPHVYDAYQLVAGGLHQGLPFSRQGLAFVAWIAATYISDVGATQRSSVKHFLLYNPLTTFWAERLEKECAERAIVIAPVSSYSRTELINRYGIAEDKLSILPVPVELPSETAYPERAISRYILSVGQLQRRKDFPMLLKAFRIVKESIGDIELRIVGKGKELANLRALARNLGLTDSVRFLGFLSNEELQSQYRNATVFALSSRQEGLGIVFIEAMSYGLPVVTTECGGSADPVLHGKTGFLSPVGDANGLARNLIFLLTEEDLLANMSTAARSRAVENYSFETVFLKLDEIYSDAFGL